mmetsp:Transcript_53113/g.126719  ORF Transcript_53113/g.126719 Transcript_53113/m.126719 type:complete len:218 (-) Transcript_53113:119-772(-)
MHKDIASTVEIARKPNLGDAFVLCEVQACGNENCHPLRVMLRLSRDFLGHNAPFKVDEVEVLNLRNSPRPNWSYFCPVCRSRQSRLGDIANPQPGGRAELQHVWRVLQSFPRLPTISPRPSHCHHGRTAFGARLKQVCVLRCGQLADRHQLRWAWRCHSSYKPLCRAHQRSPPLHGSQGVKPGLNGAAIVMIRKKIGKMLREDRRHNEVRVFMRLRK